jgi:hypothetical protein
MKGLLRGLISLISGFLIVIFFFMALTSESTRWIFPFVLVFGITLTAIGVKEIVDSVVSSSH